MTPETHATAPQGIFLESPLCRAPNPLSLTDGVKIFEFTGPGLGSALITLADG